jgi:SAM-dependent methyltransferase
MASGDYIHGYSDEEAERLEAQAEFLAPWALNGLDLSDVHTLLEIGIGVGAQTRILRSRWPQLHVIGVDISPSQLQRASQRLRGQPSLQHRDGFPVHLLRGDGARLPLADASVDAAFFLWVLEHVRDPVGVLRSTARVLKPGGRVWATEVYNRTLMIEPRKPVIDEYFAALSEAQRRVGGAPDVAPMLPTYALRAGLEISSFRWVGPHGDARDLAYARTLIRYFEGICRSAVELVTAHQLFPVERLPEVWRAFDEVVASHQPMLSCIGGRLEACKR